MLARRTRAASHPLGAMRHHRRRDRTLARCARAALTLVLAVALPGCAGGTGGTGGGSGAAAGGPASAASSATGFDGALLPAGLKRRPFALTDQYGRRVSLEQFRGRVVILAFLYSTSKSVAPLIAQQIRGALDELETTSPAVPALAVSVDRAADTPAHVRTFLRATSLTGRLRYLTGSSAQLRDAWRAYRVVAAGAGERAYERGAFVLLLDRAGAERVALPLEELTPEALAHDVRRLEGR
jgi:cytochrome oxidase Cu insertion factor (SCO1/SenC/PrrC family)